ncbi:MAG: hypothetical protein A2W33_06375 [Chloroflexi bacterium RBG_16_52_11]|nr:MAG: hypothetical protein A2W33_06375 [Chloroflexi bacterium RBG_16_52_11]
MSKYNRLSLAIRVLQELGARQLWHYIWYQLQLHSGILRWKTSPPNLETTRPPHSFLTQPLFALPERQQLLDLLDSKGTRELTQHCDEILAGQERLFGGELVRLSLEPPPPLLHWTFYEINQKTQGYADPKQIWEPGRFGWAITLARSYYLNPDERYAEAFWNYTERFIDANPPYQGQHWVSAQEVALRLVVFVFTHPILAQAPSSTPERLARLYRSIAAHAERIPPSLSYARAQNNNHLLSEAVGLYTAGLALRDHPQAARWRRLGWRWFNHGIQTQIAEDGTYVQQSTNYHRLMLQLALIAQSAALSDDQNLPQESINRLTASTLWLYRLVDPVTARVPNLGANDGASILPLASCAFEDYRPVLQAAGKAFLGRNLFTAGPWDEMSLWLNSQISGKQQIRNDPAVSISQEIQQPFRLDNPAHGSWAYFRVTSFSSRPGHADQLHVDLWWRGLNLAQDAGTYRYNDPPPWDNSLARTPVHNTLTINDTDQMTQAGRFLWLDWAQGRLLEHTQADDGTWQQLTTQHDGYRRFDLLHQRSVRMIQDGQWLVVDQVLPAGRAQVEPLKTTARLHWLLPDWPWEISEDDQSCELRLASPFGRIQLRLEYRSSQKDPALSPVSLARAGILIYGSAKISAARGWVSPTYNLKTPALSFALEVRDIPPFTLTSRWELPE